MSGREENNTAKRDDRNNPKHELTRNVAKKISANNRTKEVTNFPKLTGTKIRATQMFRG